MNPGAHWSWRTQPAGFRLRVKLRRTTGALAQVVSPPGRFGGLKAAGYVGEIRQVTGARG